MNRYFLLLIAIAFFSACNEKPAANETAIATKSDTANYEIKTGGSKLIQVAGKYNVWTKKVGDGKIKVLLLHGGPGFTHDYLECFESFLPQEGMEIYFYDQLGCGNSDIPADTSLYNVARFVEEVEEVRKGLGLENFYLFGQSWGGMLTMSYLQKYQQHVKAAIISNMTAGIKSYVSYTAKLKQQIFTPAEIATYDSLNELKAYDSPQYQDLLMNKLYTQVICRMPIAQWPEPLMRAFKKANTKIYIQMQGVDEFHVTGNFKDWEMWDSLPLIKIPTLVIGGQYDEMNPDDIRKEGKLIPNSRTYICPNGSHLSMYDDQVNYFNSVIGFLKDVEAGNFVADKK